MEKSSGNAAEVMDAHLPDPGDLVRIEFTVAPDALPPWLRAVYQATDVDVTVMARPEFAALAYLPLSNNTSGYVDVGGNRVVLRSGDTAPDHEVNTNRCGTFRGYRPGRLNQGVIFLQVLVTGQLIIEEQEDGTFSVQLMHDKHRFDDAINATCAQLVQAVLPHSMFVRPKQLTEEVVQVLSTYQPPSG